MEYGFGAQEVPSGEGDKGGKKPPFSENLVQVSVYFDSFNVKYILNKKVYDVMSDVLSPNSLL